LRAGSGGQGGGFLKPWTVGRGLTDVPDLAIAIVLSPAHCLMVESLGCLLFAWFSGKSAVDWRGEEAACMVLGLLLAYLGPESALPVVSALAAGVGAILLGWNQLRCMFGALVHLVRRRDDK
jgi:hypothetical protein